MCNVTDEIARLATPFEERGCCCTRWATAGGKSRGSSPPAALKDNVCGCRSCRQRRDRTTLQRWAGGSSIRQCLLSASNQG